jgi:hypothetical protein
MAGSTAWVTRVPYGLIDAVLIGDVKPQPLGHGQIGQRFRAARSRDHAVAPAGQFDGGGPADTPGRAGDEDGRHGGSPLRSAKRKFSG